MHSKTKAVSAPTVLAAKKVAPVINEAVKPCQKILASLMSSKNSWPFLEPVQVEALGIPEYN